MAGSRWLTCDESEAAQDCEEVGDDDLVIDHVASDSGYLSEAGSPLLNPQFLRETRKGLSVSWRIAPRLTSRSLRSQYRSSFLGYFWLVGPSLAISATWLFLTWSGVISGRNEDPLRGVRGNGHVALDAFCRSSELSTLATGFCGKPSTR